MSIISQTPKHVQNMFDFNMILNLHSYLVLFMPKTLSVVWYFIMDLILSKVHSYFALSESKSTVIFICFCCLIIFFKLCKFTQTLCGALLSKYELLYSVLLMKHLLRDLFQSKFDTKSLVSIVMHFTLLFIIPYKTIL